MDLSQAIRIRINNLMAERNLNVSKLSFLAGISRATLSKFLSGNRKFLEYLLLNLEGICTLILRQIYLKLPIISFHALRHTSISLQTASGIQAQIISKRAGHSNLSVTHNTYSHFFENGFKDVANRMNAMLAVKS